MRKNKLEPNKIMYIPNRITESMELIYQYPLTILEAPMGYGKTTAVKVFLQDTKPNTMWVSLYDDRTDIFWLKLCQQIGLFDASCQETMQTIGFPNDEIYRHEILELLKKLNFPSKTVLVIDDYHLIENSDVHILIEELIQCVIPNLHLVLTARNIGLGRFEELVLKHFIHHIPKESFEFNKTDIRNYYKKSGILLKENEINDLLALTEGWISALYLLLIHYETKGCFADCISIYTLLEKTIYAPLVQETKDFLLCICLFTNVTLEQATFLWQKDNAPKLLKTVVENNTLIKYDTTSNSYQLHSIFSTFLREEFSKKEPTIQQKVYQRAAKWFIQAGENLEAMHYSVLSHDFDQFLVVFELDQGHSLTNEQKARFDDYFQQCPNDIKLLHPIALLIYAFCLSTMNDMEQFATVCEQFLTSLNTAADIDTIERDNLMGEFEMLMSLSNYNDMNKMNEHQQLVKAFMHRPLSFLDTKGGWTLGLPSVLFMFYREPGSLAELVRLMQDDAMPCYYELTNGHGKGSDTIIESEWHYYQGDMVNAEIVMHKAIYIAEKHNQSDILICGLFLQMKMALFYGDKSKAKAIMNQMTEQVQKHLAYYLIPTIDLCEAFLSIQLQQKERIPSWIKNGDFSSSRLYFPSHPYASILYAQSLILHRDYQRLLGISDELLEVASIFPNLLGQIYLYIAIAIANNQLFRDEQAMNSLDTALTLALPDALYLPFVENTDLLLPLLRKMQLLRDKQPLLGHIITLMIDNKYNRKSYSSDSTMDLSQLTQREFEIAQLAASGLTNQEIGAKLYISVNTVKTQLKTTFNKLNINSRALLSQIFKDNHIE